MQIRRLCLTLDQPCPEGEAYEAFVSHPEHVLARLARDIGAPDVVEKSLDHPMQVPVAAGLLHWLHDTSVLESLTSQKGP